MTNHQIVALGLVALLDLCALAMLVRMIVKGEWRWGL